MSIAAGDAPPRPEEVRDRSTRRYWRKASPSVVSNFRASYLHTMLFAGGWRPPATPSFAIVFF
jgi:hypothetical protein